jgi:hypothetical protein
MRRFVKRRAAFLSEARAIAVARTYAGAFRGAIYIRDNQTVLKNVRALDNNIFERTGSGKLNPNTHQKLFFCCRLHLAAGPALYICPGRPGASS